jgi:hypothetical protein
MKFIFSNSSNFHPAAILSSMFNAGLPVFFAAAICWLPEKTS